MAACSRARRGLGLKPDSRRGDPSPARSPPFLSSTRTGSFSAGSSRGHGLSHVHLASVTPTAVKSTSQYKGGKKGKSRFAWKKSQMFTLLSRFWSKNSSFPPETRCSVINRLRPRQGAAACSGGPTSGKRRGRWAGDLPRACRVCAE